VVEFWKSIKRRWSSELAEVVVVVVAAAVVVVVEVPIEEDKDKQVVRVDTVAVVGNNSDAALEAEAMAVEVEEVRVLEDEEVRAVEAEEARVVEAEATAVLDEVGVLDAEENAHKIKKEYESQLRSPNTEASGSERLIRLAVYRSMLATNLLLL
jgi:hypothetical protein